MKGKVRLGRISLEQLARDDAELIRDALIAYGRQHMALSVHRREEAATARGGAEMSAEEIRASLLAESERHRIVWARAEAIEAIVSRALKALDEKEMR